jgi:hypothetical protein
MMGFFQLDLFSNMPQTNATLTCTNGHTCRVWVNLNRNDVACDINHGEMIYEIVGYEVPRAQPVFPECCPECGAEWLVPNKHNTHKG